jgi:alpha-L-rhamnosidase
MERLRKMPEDAFWNFCDWVPGWKWGVPPSGVCATVHRLTWFAALVAHMEAFTPAGEAHNAARLMLARRLNSEFYIRRGFISHEQDEHWEPSEHAEALYRICQAKLGVAQSPWPGELLEQAKASQCSFYFSFYKHLAMLPDDLMSHLKPWREMIENGLTTFAENPEPTRSDCHAWSSHPLLGFFQIVAGVTSIAPGWRRVKIEPRPGSLRKFDALIAHPDGDLRVLWEDEQLVVDTPVPAEFVWQGQKSHLEPGLHTIGLATTA